MSLTTYYCQANECKNHSGGEGCNLDFTTIDGDGKCMSFE